MLKKLIFPFLFILLFSNCGYTPVYLNSSEADFKISNLKINGSNEVNSIVENKLKKYLTKNSKKKYDLEIFTNYKKISVAKDTTGNATNFKLIIDLNLNYTEINAEQKNKPENIFFSEEIIIKRNQNNYEQNTYERIVIKNMSEVLIEKIILYLSRS